MQGLFRLHAETVNAASNRLEKGLNVVESARAELAEARLRMDDQAAELHEADVAAAEKMEEMLTQRQRAEQARDSAAKAGRDADVTVKEVAARRSAAEVASSSKPRSTADT